MPDKHGEWTARENRDQWEIERREADRAEPLDPARCESCGYVKHEKTFQRDRCPQCNNAQIWISI